MTAFLAMAIGLAGCASKRPVLYPNAHYSAVGKTVAERDIDDCQQIAETAGAKEDSNSRVAKKAGHDAAVGGAAGAGWGAVKGDMGDRAAAGAAAGAAGGAMRGALDGDDSDSVYRRFVERCLRDKGYDPIGWR